MEYSDVFYDMLAKSLPAYQQEKGLPASLTRDLTAPGLGNLYALRTFTKSHPNDGMWCVVKINKYGELQDLHGSSGTQNAVVKVGGVISNMIHHYRGIAFRESNGTFFAWLYNLDQALLFTRELRKIVGGLGPVAGNEFTASNNYTGHQVTLSIGIGYNQLQAVTATQSNSDQETVISMPFKEPLQDWQEGQPIEGQSKPLFSGLKLNNPLQP